MDMAWRVVTNTPPWVAALLAYLLWQGWKSLETRTVSIWRALAVPAVFIVMGLSRIAFRSDLGAAAYLAWAAAAVVFAPIGLLTGPRIVSVDRSRSEITRLGSPVPLVRDVLVFTVQYAVAVADAMHVDGHAMILLGGRAVSGATAGYFLGWALDLARRYRQAPEAG